jgi:hypothetical protein
MSAIFMSKAEPGDREKLHARSPRFLTKDPDVKAARTLILNQIGESADAPCFEIHSNFACGSLLLRYIVTAVNSIRAFVLL